MPLRQKLKLAFVKKFGIERTTNCSTDFLEVCVILELNILQKLCIKYLYLLTNCNRFTMDLILNHL